VQNDPRPIYFFKDPKFHTARVIIEDCWLSKRALRGGEESPVLDSDGCGLDLEDPVLTESMAERFPSYTARAITMEYTFRAAEWGFQENLEDAENWLEKGLYFYGRDSTSLYNAGALCARYQRYEQAREYFEAALEWDPTHQPSRDALKRLGRLGQ
jgi:tetratricopeptide (TPR) repeat protein